MKHWILAAVLFVPTAALAQGQIVESVACQSDPAMTYAYYLPKAYSPQRSWPVLFVFDPRGRGAWSAGLFRDAAEEFGWIVVSSNDTRSDDPNAPNARAIQAMWTDVPRRFSVDRRRVYTAGFSGGALLAWSVAERSGIVAGVLGVGGRVTHPERITLPSFAWYGLTGEADFNYSEMRKIEDRLAAVNASRRLLVFEGKHQWPPPAALSRALGWMELEAMRRGTRPREDALVARLLSVELAAADSARDSLMRLREYDAIIRVFDGLTKVDEIVAATATLRKSHDVRALLRDEEKGKQLEQAHQQRFPKILATVQRASDPPLAAALARDLEIRQLQRMAQENSYRGRAARRVLETLFTQLDFYLARELSDASRRAVVKDVAAMIREGQ